MPIEHVLKCFNLWCAIANVFLYLVARIVEFSRAAVPDAVSGPPLLLACTMGHGPGATNSRTRTFNKRTNADLLEDRVHLLVLTKTPMSVEDEDKNIARYGDTRVAFFSTGCPRHGEGLTSFDGAFDGDF